MKLNAKILKTAWPTAKIDLIKVRGRERQDWLIQLANREGAWPKRPYECFWSKVGVSRIGQG